MTSATIKSARRVIEIMEHFDRKRCPLGLKEICEELDYPVSSGAAMLKSLMMLGYLEYDRTSRTYLPTMRIAVLGRWVADQLFSEFRMLPLMEELRERTRETIILGTQSESRAQYVHVLRSPQPLSYSAEPGSLRPLTRSGVGLVLLSTKSNEEIDALVYRSNYDEPNRGRRVPLKDVMEKVNVIRKQEYFFSRHLYTEGIGVIAIALPAAPYNRTFVIAVGGPVLRLEKNLSLNLSAMKKAIRTFLPAPMG
jgi:DNA-binding IclR family transcriptional regulator